MDICCVVCGEPWYSDLSDMEQWERDLFRKGSGCPCCQGLANDNWEPRTLSDIENGDGDPMERIGAHEDHVAGRAPRWEKPAPTTLWECDGCGVRSARDANGELIYDMHSKAKLRQWYHRPWYEDHTPGAEPSHTFGSGVKVCEFCHISCKECGVDLANHVEFSDVYDEGHPFVPDGYYRTSDSVCVECLSVYDNDSDEENYG